MATLAMNRKESQPNAVDEEVDDGAENDNNTFIIQREIELQKRPGEKFGVRIANVSRRYIVISICEGHGEDIATHLCPAMRSSLEFGDEIATVNGIQVNSALSAEQTTELLDNSANVKLTIRVRPFITHKTLRRHCEGPMGLKIMDGIVTEVTKYGPADHAGVRANRGVIAINGRFVIGMSDAEIADVLRSSWTLKKDTVTVSLMGANKFKIVRDAVLKIPPKERPIEISSENDHVVSPIPKLRGRNRSRSSPISISPAPSPNITRSNLASPAISAPVANSRETSPTRPLRASLATVTIEETVQTTTNLMLPRPPRATRSQSVPYDSQFELVGTRSPVLLDPISAACRSSPSAVQHSAGCTRRTSAASSHRTQIISGTSNSRSNSPGKNNDNNISPLPSPIISSKRSHCPKCDLDAQIRNTESQNNLETQEKRKISKDLEPPSNQFQRTKSLTHEDLVQLGYTFHSRSPPSSPGMVYNSLSNKTAIDGAPSNP